MRRDSTLKKPVLYKNMTTLKIISGNQNSDMFSKTERNQTEPRREWISPSMQPIPSVQQRKPAPHPVVPADNTEDIFDLI